MLSLTLRQLEYATAVAHHGGMTAAAEALHVSQPALSVAVAQLEAILGRALFLRRPGGRITPTSFGRGWLERAEVQLAGLIRLAVDDSQHRDVRLAVFEDIAPASLAPLIRASALENLVLIPQVTGFEALADALRKGRADLALTWDLGLETDIARRVLVQVSPHVVLAADHPLAGRASLTLADIANEPLVLADQGLSIGHMRALFSQRGLTARIAHRTASLELMRSYAANGLGVGISYTNPVARLSQDGRPLATRLLTDAGTEPLVLAHLAANPLSGAALALAALLPQALPMAPFSIQDLPDP